MKAQLKKTTCKEKKAAIYARVSSQKQKEDETIESQIEALHVHALQEGYRIPENWLFVDNGISGEMLQRPALDELRDVAQLESLETILIYSPDRLARKYSHQLILLEEFRRHGVNVCFLKKAPSNDTPEAVMFSHFQGIFAEYERALILDRSRRGRLHKAKQGDPRVLPSVPFGYKKVRIGHQVLVELIEPQADAVRDMFRWYVYDKLTLNSIARRLTENHVRSQKGSPWAASTVRDIINNPAYTGTAYYGKTEKCDGDQITIRHYSSGRFSSPKKPTKMVSKENWYPINVPQIISENDFEMAQEQLKINKDLAARNTKEPSLLQGLIVCGACGHRFYKRIKKYKGKIIGYYYCKSHTKNNLAKCSNGWARQEELDTLVYTEVIKLLQNPIIVREELSRRVKEASDVEGAKEREADLRKEIQKISIERNRLLDAYQEGTMDLKELKKRNQQLIARKNMIDKEIRAVEALKLEKEQGEDLAKVFDSLVQRIKHNADELPLDEKRKLIRLLVEEVVIGMDGLKIVHCISPHVIAKTVNSKCQLKTDVV
jgi:site-specific DNA recombinase